MASTLNRSGERRAQAMANWSSTSFFASESIARRSFPAGGHRRRARSSALKKSVFIAAPSQSARPRRLHIMARSFSPSAR